ncbi:MAG TPA: chemotaxis-specific protein-glutamate methyltransferase CheB [Chloroflexia bacterium]|nr:chemotaxis-specific protein-glutamate methyltransferase CheB [Chloroflexia bacterium]
MSRIKVLIVEDSPLVADILKNALESDPQLQVVGIATNGQEAVEMTPRLAPDLITMDVWMPVMDGFATVEWIMANKPTPILVITSSKLNQDVQISLRMLSAGALDVIEKPSLSDDEQWELRQAELIARVKLLAGVRVITHLRGKLHSTTKPNNPAPPSGPSVRAGGTRPLTRSAFNNLRSGVNRPGNNSAETISFPERSFYRVIAVASSTGGPSALLAILRHLPPNLPCGVLIVQHISEGFTQGLVEWLQREVPLNVRLARSGEVPVPGEVLLPPDRHDMEVSGGERIVTRNDGSSLLRPNADVLFNSVAQIYGPRAIGVILTGMGSDGAKGIQTMYKAGAYTIAQDESTSLIYGMPRAAVELGGVREVLKLDQIAPRLCKLLQQPIASDIRTGKEGSLR